VESSPAAAYVEVVRGTPLLVQIPFIHFVLPTFGVHLPAFTSGMIALSLNSAACAGHVHVAIHSASVGAIEFHFNNSRSGSPANRNLPKANGHILNVADDLKACAHDDPAVA